MTFQTKMKQNTELNYWLNIRDETDAKARVISDKDFDTPTTKHVDIILKNLRPEKTDAILELGCGIGRLMKPLSQHCDKIVGVDISDAMIGIASKYCYGVQNVFFKPMETDHTILMQNDGFDKAYSIIVLQHIEKYKATRLLMELCRILKLGGKVLVQYPNLLKCKKGYTNDIVAKLQMGDLIPRMEYYTKEEIEFVFDIAGLKILEVMDIDTDFYVLAQKVEQKKFVETVIIASTKLVNE